jgi:translation initiation factor IF-2
VLGLNSAPEAGDQFDVVPNEARAREVTDYRERKRRETRGAAAARSSLESMMSAMKDGNVKDFPILVKADVQGSAEAIVQALEKIGNAEIKSRVIHYAVGGINESDIGLAQPRAPCWASMSVPRARRAMRRRPASKSATTISFTTRRRHQGGHVGQAGAGTAQKPSSATQDLEVFNITKVGKVAGCQVTEGPCSAAPTFA